MMGSKAVFLLLAGAIGGIGMLLFTSGKVFPVAPEIVTATVAFIAWETLGVTVAKMAADQIVFSQCLGRDCRIAVGTLVRTRVLPAAALFALASLAKYPPLLCVLLFVSVALDSVAVVLQAKLNAGLAVRRVFVASLLNYPVFLLLLFAAAMMTAVELAAVALCFTLASLLRLLFLLAAANAGQRQDPGLPPMQIEGSVVLSAYQCINYWIFKAGQVVAGMGVYAAYSSDIARFMFFWTAIEMLDRFQLALSPLVFGKMVNGEPRYGIAMSVLLGAMFLAFASGSMLLLGTHVEPVHFAALAAQSLLLLYPNYLIFLAVRRADYLRLTLAGAAACLLASAASATLFFSGQKLPALLLLTPCQMLLLCVFLRVAERQPLRHVSHDTTPATEPV